MFIELNCTNITLRGEKDTNANYIGNDVPDIVIPSIGELHG